MKEKTIPLVALAMLSVVSAVRAENSVTLYGVIDTAINYTNSAGRGTTVAMAAGNTSGSRWGLKGSEDLGNGLKAIFRLENGFNSSTGTLLQGGREFGRQAYVGLTSVQYGTLTLGRQYNSFQDLLPYDNGGGVGMLDQIALNIYDNDDINNTWRSDNSIKYVSPSLNGLTVEGLYGFSNQAGAFANNRTWSVGASYQNGPLRLDAAYVLANKPNANASGSISTYYGPTTSPFPNAGGFARNELYGFGGSYSLGKATVGLMYSSSRFTMNSGEQVRFQNFDANIRYTVTPFIMVGAAYAYTLEDSAASFTKDAHFNQFVIGAQYYFSKRTDVYIDAGYQRATGAKAWLQGAGGQSSTGNQAIVTLGIRHKF